MCGQEEAHSNKQSRETWASPYKNLKPNSKNPWKVFKSLLETSLPFRCLGNPVLFYKLTFLVIILTTEISM